MLKSLQHHMLIMLLTVMNEACAKIRNHRAPCDYAISNMLLCDLITGNRWEVGIILKSQK